MRKVGDISAKLECTEPLTGIELDSYNKERKMEVAGNNIGSTCYTRQYTLSTRRVFIIALLDTYLRNSLTSTS